jgi:hypothetical protein
MRWVSIFDVAATSLLLFLGLPLLLLSGRVAIDAPRAGAAFTLGLGAACCVLLRHVGSRLVDVTLAAVALCAVALAFCTLVGFLRSPTRR